MTKTNLYEKLGIFEAPEYAKVKCQAPNCNRPIWKAIHVVREPEGIKIYGSSCFKRLFEKNEILETEPTYTSSNSQHLSVEEIQQLQANTERFIREIQADYEKKSGQLLAKNLDTNFPIDVGFERPTSTYPKEPQLPQLTPLAPPPTTSEERPYIHHEPSFSSSAKDIPRPFTNKDTGEVISPLVAFLTHAALEAGDNQAQAGQDAVQLMTVHAAKGLEFDAVFIGGLEEGLFPHENSSLDTKALEEERRLMYVAITRARQRLYISYAQTRMLHGYTRYGMRSRFLDELPEHTTKWLSPKDSGYAPPSGGRARFGGAGYGGASGNSYSDNRKSYSGGYAQGGGSGGEQRYENKSRWRDDNDGEPRYGNKYGGKDAADFGSAHVPFKPKAAAGNALGLQIGDAVFHAKFGEGMVLALQGDGEAATAKIKFPRAGEKWLALGVAKLQKI
jgi:hypothetical protein